jgi:hypothetical protein
MRSIRARTSLILLAASLAACGDDGTAPGDGGGSTTTDGPPATSTEGDVVVGTTEGSAGTQGGTSTGGLDTGSGGSGDSGDTEPVIPSEPFSFFVTSLRALQELSGSEQGFGGDLRFGETGPGAGLRGADEICATIAEMSMPGASAKQWRAFLSATDDGTGNPVNAIDRVGDGPWYDRLGRTFALTREDLLTERPTNIDPAILDDFPNEDGVPNHQPDPTQPEVDNHDTLTGTNENGQLYGADATCLDWTSAEGDLASEGRPRVGHMWPRYGGPGGGGPGPGGGDGSMANWMSSLDEAGCAPGVNLLEQGGPIPGEVTVGSGGGYGAIYCFALNP